MNSNLYKSNSGHIFKLVYQITQGPHAFANSDQCSGYYITTNVNDGEIYGNVAIIDIAIPETLNLEKLTSIRLYRNGKLMRYFFPRRSSQRMFFTPMDMRDDQFGVHQCKFMRGNTVMDSFKFVIEPPTSKSSDTECCCICFEPFVPATKVMLHCGHSFCAACLLAYIKSKGLLVPKISFPECIDSYQDFECCLCRCTIKAAHQMYKIYL